MPLPSERPGMFSFTTGAMDDPTSPDGTDVAPLPVPKPATASAAGGAPKAKTKPHLNPKR